MKNAEIAQKRHDIEDILTKARGSVKGVNASNYKPIPGFTKYEVNSAGEVRRILTSAVQQIPTGKKAYYLFDDKGARKSLSPERIKELVKFDKTKAQKKEGEKKETKKAKIVELHNAGKTLKEIVALTGFEYNSVYILLRGHITLTHFELLKNKKLSKSEIINKIHEKTGYTKDYIEWRITK